MQYVLRFYSDKWLWRQGSDHPDERLQIFGYQVSDRIHVQRRDQCGTCEYCTDNFVVFRTSAQVQQLKNINFYFCSIQDQLSSLLKTAEDLRIKGLAEVSWRDEDDGKNATHHKSSAALRGKVGHDPMQRATASAAYSPRLSDSDYQASGSACSSVAIPTVTQTEKHSDSDEICIQPTKKKRGRPPLDDDFDSYSTPKISHVESTAGTLNLNHYTESISIPLDKLSDDGSHDMHAHTNSMLEQNMEIQIDEDEHALQGNIVPKTERPDTPPASRDYYDDDENPGSPIDDAIDTSAAQVNQVSPHTTVQHQRLRSIDISVLLSIAFSGDTHAG